MMQLHLNPDLTEHLSQSTSAFQAVAESLQASMDGGQASSSKDKTHNTLQIQDFLSHHTLGQLKNLNQATKCTVHLLGVKPSTTED
jgi:hypothetical protein